MQKQFNWLELKKKKKKDDLLELDSISVPKGYVIYNLFRKFLIYLQPYKTKQIKFLNG